MKSRCPLFASLALVCLFAPPPARAVGDPTLASAEAALRAGDLASAVQGHRDYLAQHADAPDAARESLHLAFILDKQKATTADVRTAFQSVEDNYPQSSEAGEAMYRRGLLSLREKDVATAKGIFAQVPTKHPGTAGAAMANFSLANYFIKDRRYDTANERFDAIARDPTVPPRIADEALLETAFLHVQHYLDNRADYYQGKTTSDVTGESQRAILEAGREGLTRVVSSLDQRKGDTEIHQTAAAYAECGIGEVYLLEGLPALAEKHYRSALARPEALVPPQVRTLGGLGLGIALLRQRRLIEAGAVLDKVIENPSTGVVLYSLLVPAPLIAEARMWRAEVYNQFGQMDKAMASVNKAMEYFDHHKPATPLERIVFATSMRYIDGMREHPGGIPASADPEHLAGVQHDAWQTVSRAAANANQMAAAEPAPQVNIAGGGR